MVNSRRIQCLQRLIFLALVTLPFLAWPKLALGEAPKTSELTLEGALKEATSRSPVIQRVKATLEEKEWKRFAAFGGGFLPKVSVSALHYFDTKYSETAINFGGNPLLFPGFYPNSQASLDVTLPIFNGFSSLNALQAASLAEEAARKDLARAEFQVEEEVGLAFYKALAAADLKEVALQNVKTLEDHLKQIKIRRRGGVATNYDSLRVEVQLNEARADAIDAEDNAVLTRKKLTQLLALENDERPLKGSLPVPNSDPVRRLEFSESTKDRSDIEAMNLRAEAASKAEAARSTWFVPSVALGGQYTFYETQIFNETISNTGNFKQAYNVGVFLKWNLFDGGVSYAEARAASSEALQAAKSAQIAKLEMPYDFAYWKRRYLSNTDHYLSKKFDITRSEESVRLAKEEERAGTRTASETLDAELDLFRARAGVVNAQVNAAEAKIRLELALGRRIL